MHPSTFVLSSGAMLRWPLIVSKQHCPARVAFCAALPFAVVPK